MLVLLSTPRVDAAMARGTCDSSRDPCIAVCRACHVARLSGERSGDRETTCVCARKRVRSAHPHEAAHAPENVQRGWCIIGHGGWVCVTVWGVCPAELLSVPPRLRPFAYNLHTYSTSTHIDAPGPAPAPARCAPWRLGICGNPFFCRTPGASPIIPPIIDAFAMLARPPLALALRPAPETPRITLVSSLKFKLFLTYDHVVRNVNEPTTRTAIAQPHTITENNIYSV